jgi:predicted nucleic acid-binding protein
MSFTFDSSSIFDAIVRGGVRILVGGCTLDLARYELGNILWKRRMLIKDLGDDEYKRLVGIVKRVLGLMEVVSLDCREDDIAELARDLDLTFYDASYVFLAKSRGVPLVTEDSIVRSRVGDHVEVLRVEDLLSRSQPSKY